MTKRIFFSIIIPALLINTVYSAEIYNKDGNKIDLYSKVYVRRFFSEKNNIFSGDGSNISLGLKGDTKISDQISGFGRLEFHGKTNQIEEKNENKNSLAYVGLKFSNLGSIDYGYNYGILYDIKNWTDMLPIHKSSYISQPNSYMSGYNRNLLTYRNNDFFGLMEGFNFALQYQGKNISKNEKGVLDNLKSNGEGFGVSAKYDLGSGLSFGGAYTKSDRMLNEPEKEDGMNNDKDAQGWDIGVKYDANNVYLAAMYGETYNMSRFTKLPVKENEELETSLVKKTGNIELVAQYLFDEINLKPSVSYVQSIAEGILDLGDNQKQDLLKYVSLGAFYSLNKNLTALIDYKINLVNKNDFTDKNNVNRSDVFGLGLTYKL